MRIEGLFPNELLISQLPKVPEIKVDDSEESNDENLSVSSEKPGFQNFFRDSWAAYEEANAVSKEYTAQLMTGTLDDLAAFQYAGEKANILFEYNLTLRNKAVEAFNEIMKTQV